MNFGLRHGKLPKTIVVEAERIKAADKVRQEGRNLQSDYKRLVAFPDLLPLPTLENINKEWLHGIIEGKKNEVDAMAGITENERIERKAAWTGIERAACIHVSQIARIRAKYGDAVKFDEEIRLPWIPNPEAIAEKLCARPVPEEATDHHKRLMAVCDAIAELRLWEYDHDVKRIPLDILMRWTNQTLCERWATGDILNPNPDSLPHYVRAAVKMKRQSDLENIL